MRTLIVEADPEMTEEWKWMGAGPPGVTEMTVPHTIRTERLLLRPFCADDAVALLPVLEANQDHLSRWIPLHVWRPVLLPELAMRLEGFAAAFTEDREWRYAIVSSDGTTMIGEVDLFPRAAPGRVPYAESDRAEIGYWLRADRSGQGLATEAARAMGPTCFRSIRSRCAELGRRLRTRPGQPSFASGRDADVPSDA